MSLTSKIALSVVASLTGTADLTTPRADLSKQYTSRLADGTGLGQANRIFSDQRTLAASATEDLDLAGVLADALGSTITMAKLKALIVTAASGNTNNVNLTRPASNGVPLFLAASDGIGILPGGMFAWVAPTAAGVTVTAGTGDLLTFTNSSSGSSVTYDVVIIGSTS